MSIFWTSMPKTFGSADKIEYIKFGLTLLLCAILLSSCGPVSSPFSNNNNTAQPASDNAPQASSIAPMSPPGADQRALQPGLLGTTYNQDGLPNMQPARGMNVDNLFVNNITDPDQRFQRVENAVLELRRDLDSAMPAIVRLVAVEKDMSQLVTQLQSLLRNEPPTVSPTPAMNTPQALSPVAPLRAERSVQPAQVAPPPQKAVKVQSTAKPIMGDVTVKGLRIGEHKGKTRLVLDISGATSYSYDLDNNENLLVIELPNAGWSGKKSWASSKAPLLSSYTVQPSGNGSRVIIQLKKPVKIIYEDTIKPNGTPNYRVVIDLAAQ
jgi:hypothetical protein